MSASVRAIDPTIVDAIEAAPVRDNGTVDTAAVATDLGVTHEYLRARLRQLHRTGVLKAEVRTRIRWGKAPVDASTVMDAWRESETVAEAARRTGLSRSGVLQRIGKLRPENPDLQQRPHRSVTKEDREREILNKLGVG